MLRTLALSVLFVGAITCAANQAIAACNDGEDRNVTIINDTSRTMLRFYATNSRNTSWGQDRIDYSIPPGDELTVDMDDGSCRCQMDLLVISVDNRRWSRYGYNVCTAERWRLVN